MGDLKHRDHGNTHLGMRRSDETMAARRGGQALPPPRCWRNHLALAQSGARGFEGMRCSVRRTDLAAGSVPLSRAQNLQQAGRGGHHHGHRSRRASPRSPVKAGITTVTGRGGHHHGHRSRRASPRSPVEAGITTVTGQGGHHHGHRSRRHHHGQHLRPLFKMTGQPVGSLWREDDHGDLVAE